MDKIILWEAHRGGGGGYEMPEGCPLSFEYGWMLGGIPEADVNMTADGVMISLHDPTLQRITDAPSEIATCPVGELTLAEVRRWSVGGKDYPGQHIPTIAELLEKLRENPARQIIIDYKRVDLELLAGMIRDYGVVRQVTFAFCDPAICGTIKRLLPEITIKQWVGGNAESIKNTFREAEKAGFRGFEQIQLHLNDLAAPRPEWRYQLEPEFLSEALPITRDHGVLLQVLPWNFEREDLHRLLSLGIRSFAVDYPHKFCRLSSEWFALNCWKR